MRTTTLIMGILGGVFGILLGLLAMAIGGTSNALDEGSGNTTVWLGVSAIAASVLAIVAAGLYFGGKWPGLMALLLLVAAIWHLISISYFAIPGTLFMLLASLFAFLGRNSIVRTAPTPDVGPRA